MTDTNSSATTVADRDPSPAVGRRSRLRIMAGTAPRWRLLVVVAAALVAFFAVSQAQGPDRFRSQLAGENEGDLARILASLSTESSALQDELAALKVQLAITQNSSSQQGAASEELQAQLNSLQVLAGTAAVTGPGIEVVIGDSTNKVTYEVLVSSVQELRDAGAEALSINGRRVGVASSFTAIDGRIALDGVALPVPYTIEAIGPAATMEGGLKIPGGTLDTLQAINGVEVDVRRVAELDLPALANAPSFSSARPVG